MNYINNWLRPITLGAADTSTALDLPDGTYRLCIIGAGDLFEVVDAAVVGGTATLTRGLECTAAQTWLSGSTITASVTAEMLESFAAAGATWGGITGSLADQADLQAALNSKATSAQGAKADSAVQPGNLAAVASSGSYSDLASKPFIPAAPADIGAGTAAQGALADTAVQPPALTAGLLLKVDKVAGYDLSQENYTPAEKAKLASLDGSLWKGEYPTLAALQAAHPTAAPGSSANVDSGAGDPVLRYIWDDNDTEWVAQAGSSDPVTAAQVKALYEANPDTNAYTDTEKTKLGGIAAGATVNVDTDSLSEGSSNLYHTAARVLAAVLSGLSLATGTPVVSTDNVLVAVGKLQKQITDLNTVVAGKQAALISATNIKTINGGSLLGAGDLAVLAAPAPVITEPTIARTLSLTDAGAYIRPANAEASIITVAPQSSVAWAADTEVHIRRAGAGNLILSAGAGVSLNAPSGGTLVMTDRMSVTLKRVATDVWDVIGQTVAA
ncbi:hypothetical protein [Pseudomonas sp. GWSMS-1]|uniref:hypothetical protein n=1 Tax=Pseudomonas sp. GWSMS-1 TaxID=3308997 RepID=UPI003CEAB1D0